MFNVRLLVGDVQSQIKREKRGKSLLKFVETSGQTPLVRGWLRGYSHSACRASKAESSGEDPRATGGLVSGVRQAEGR